MPYSINRPTLLSCRHHTVFDWIRRSDIYLMETVRANFDKQNLSFGVNLAILRFCSWLIFFLRVRLCEKKYAPIIFLKMNVYKLKNFLLEVFIISRKMCRPMKVMAFPSKTLRPDFIQRF